MGRHSKGGQKHYKRAVPASYLEKEIAGIQEKLGNDVIFIGSIAVMAHTESIRPTKDIDIIVPYASSDAIGMLIDYGFSKDKKGKWYSPGGVRVDFYTSGEEIGGIPVEDIERDSELKSWRSHEIRVPRLEHVLLMKLVAAEKSPNPELRAAHRSDLRTVVRDNEKLSKIDWNCAEQYQSNVKKRLENVLE
jgi:hypothetical protein